MKKIIYITLTIQLLLYVNFSYASHIVGGVINYRWISGTTYEITMRIYRDCGPGSSDFDGAPGGSRPFASLGLFNETTNSFVQEYRLTSPVVTSIIPVITNPCMVTTGICLEQGVYTTTITLPSATTPYYLSYVRCCRNGSITNIPSPGSTGASFTVRIPPTTPYQNTNPVYNTFPPVYICQNAPLIFNHSAFDANGDSLYYELCNPYQGGSTAMPTPAPPPAAPYTPLTFSAPYSASDPMGSSPPPAVALTIDPNTGVLTGTPPTLGQFVVGVCVSEYRGGVFLSRTMRDVQFNVVNCPIPIANIPSSSIDPSTGIGTYQTNCDSFTVSFRQTSSGATSYHWDFGVAGITTDTSNVSSPRYTYTDTGIYKITLVAYDAAGCLDTSYAYVRVYPGFTPNFFFDNECVDTAVQFIDSSRAVYGNINFWRWTFGDIPSIPSSIPNPSHLYAAPGTYTVSLQVKSNLGCDKTVRKTVVIDPKPVAAFTNDTTCINSAVAFRSTSTISSGTIRQYNWTFGDGSPASSSINPIHTYTSTGTFPVSLSIISDSGCSASVTRNITIFPRPTVITSNDTTVCPGSRNQIAASGGTRYIWTPATGLSSTSARAPFATPGVNTMYYVTVVDSNRCNSRDSVQISYYSNTPAFSFTNECRDTAVQFTDLSSSTSGPITQWNWSFGDLTSSPLQNPLHLYATQGLYPVKLVITSSRGCKDSITQSVRIYPIPNPGFTIDTTCVGYGVYFNDTTRYYLQSDTIRSRSWLFSNGGSATSNPYTTVFNTSGTQSATLTVISDSGCLQRVTRTFTVFPNPTITLNNDTTICPYLPLQLNAGGGIRYYWLQDSTLTDTSIFNPIARPVSSPTTYYVHVVDANRCQNNDSVTIKLHTLYPVDAGIDTSVCLAPGSFYDSVQIIARGGIIYNWTPLYNISNPTIPNPYVAPDVNTMYYAAITDTNNCTQIDSVKVIVLDPTLNILTATDTFLCNKDTIQIRVADQGVAGYSWTPTGSISSSTIQSPLFFPSDTTRYIVTVVNYCYTKKDTITLFVFPLPNVSFTFDTTCLNSPVNFTNTSSGAIQSYYWSFGDSSFSSLSNPIHTYTRDTIYRVLLVDTTFLGCVDSSSSLLTVHPLPQIQATPDTSLCPNSYTSLLANGGVQYIWSPAIALDNPNSNNPTTIISTNQTYTLTVRSTYSCNSFDTVKVTYYNLNPNFSLSNECLDTAVVFIDSSTTNAGIINTWFWNMGNLHTEYIQNPIYRYTTPGTYTVRLFISTTAGCDTFIEKPITIFPLPQLNIARLDSICIGDTYQINADSNLQYAWDPTPGISPINVHNPILNPVVNTKYMVTLQDSNQCVNRDSFTLKVHLLPNANIDAVPSILCRGNTLNLQGSGNGTYIWSPGMLFSDSTSANPSILLSDTMWVSLQVTGLLGCKNYDSVLLLVQQPVIASAAPDTTVCKGDPLQLLSSGGLYYQWNPSINIIGSNQQQNPFITSDTNRMYVVTVSNDCFSDSATATIQVNPLPYISAGPDQIIYRGTQAILQAQGTASFQWWPDEYIQSPYSAQTSVSPLFTTAYLLRGQDANGCVSYDTVWVKVESNTVLLLPNAFSPNGDGVNDIFRISKYLNIQKLESFNIYNRWGELVYTTSNLEDGWNGVYKNLAQPLGVYTWYIKAIDYENNTIIKKGEMTLLR